MAPLAASLHEAQVARLASGTAPAGPPRLHLAPASEVPAGDLPARARPVHDAAALYRAHGEIVYRRCLRLLRDPETARDATQEVFLKLVRARAHLGDREDVVPWLYRVATNHCLNLERDWRRHGETALEDGPEPACPGCDPVDRLLVQRLLTRFDAVTRLIAVAVLVDEREHEEVAAALGLSRRTMARKLERFVELVRRLLVVSGDAQESRP
ncbi:MAG: sigma-70 family RNA polymerase sigma factor [Anaeromyxobacteraceae bacterium]|nr:sigma-70 family RNA polymerase sigma factor [Anaeromyxobacteraceae bacterium]